MTPSFQRPVLDRRVAFDEQSRNHPVRPLLAGKIVRKTTLHTIPRPLPLDQGSEGACVGFGWAGQLAVGPIFNPSDNAGAIALYQSARAIDRSEGRNFPEGASVLAGAKATKKTGRVTGYKWAFGINDVVDTLIDRGPVVLGVNWYESMYETDRVGKVIINGSLVGGHCILATGYVHQHPQWGGNWIQWVNSWGPHYGVNGVGYIAEHDLALLLRQNGEAVIATEIAPNEPRPKRTWADVFADLFGWSRV